jgi:hypothetical protein
MPEFSVVMALTILAAVLIGVIHAYSGNILSTTLWAGRAIAPPDTEALMPTGLQDAITPPWQTRLTLVWIIGYAALLIVGSLQFWYFGVLAVGLALFVSAVARALLPRRVDWYLRLLMNSLANREANYQKQGDALRAEAARAMFTRVALLLERVAASDMRVPSQLEAKATPIGQLDDYYE